jgi:hypothetical protein
MGLPYQDSFLKYYEDVYMKHLLENRSILFYAPYVDDIPIIYDQTLIQTLTAGLNTVHKNIIFKPTLESNNNISYLALLLKRKANHIELDMYRMPTAAITTLHYQSNHPTEQKVAAYRYLLTRMNTLPLQPEQRNCGRLGPIQYIANENEHPNNFLHQLNFRTKQK